MPFFLRSNVKYFTLRCVLLLIIDGMLSGASIGFCQGNLNSGSGTLEDPYAIPSSNGNVKIDAVLDDQAWQEAFVMDLNYELEPGENVPPPVRTEVLLTYDDLNLYAAFRCYDADLEAIQAHLSDRDHLGNDDCVTLVIDTFNDERRCYNLCVNSLGVQEDYIQTEQSGGSSWDAIWNSAGRITDWGYVVEMAVPFNQLRFQRTDGAQVWGFDAVRSYPRSQNHRIGSFPRDRSNNCYLCQAIKIRGFEGVTPGRNVEFTPTVTAVRTDARPDFPDGDLEKENEETDFGLTTRWGMTPNLTFNGTINPDFSQVEADAWQLDINQPFALYYSERRPFFLEGTDYFNTLKTAVYTRTLRDPEWGLKLSGKENVHTIGAYVVRDDLTNLIFPGSQSSGSTSMETQSTASILRYKLDIGNRYTLGALFTDREGDDYSNRVLSLDGNFLVTRTDQVQLQVLGSRTKYPHTVALEFDQKQGSFDDLFVAFEYDHDSRNIYWWLDYDYVGKDFRADLGFMPMVDYQNVEGGLFYTWYPAQETWWSRFQAGNEFNYYADQDGNLLQKGGALWFSYSGAMQSSLYLRGYHYREAYNDAEFDLTWLYVSMGFRPAGNLQLYLWSYYGDRIDYANTRSGERLRLNPYIEHNVNRHLRLSFDHTFERLNVDEGRLYTANISQMTAVYQFNVRAFFRSILQYVDYEYTTDLYTFDIEPEYRHFFAQLLFSYKINPWTVFYLGYTNNFQGSREFDLIQRDRTFFVKLGYAWTR